MISRWNLTVTLWRNIVTPATDSKREHQAMTTYILMETALRMLTNAYLLSLVLLIATSYIGLLVIEMIEEGDPNPFKTKWFN